MKCETVMCIKDAYIVFHYGCVNDKNVLYALPVTMYVYCEASLCS